MNQFTNWRIFQLTNDEFLQGKLRSRANQQPATSNQHLGLKIRFTENFLLFGVTKNTEQASYKKIEQYWQ
jgi:hypothetical protein